MAPLTPDFRWAQRRDKLFLTVHVPNVKKESADLRVTPDGRVYFHGWGGEIGREAEYELDTRLLHEVKAQESQCGVSPRNVHFVIMKTDDGPYWQRLLREPGRNIHCAVDWDLWLDEDEADEFDFGTHFGSRDMADLDYASDSGDESGGDDDDERDDDREEEEEGEFEEEKVHNTGAQHDEGGGGTNAGPGDGATALGAANAGNAAGAAARAGGTATTAQSTTSPVAGIE